MKLSRENFALCRLHGTRMQRYSKADCAAIRSSGQYESFDSWIQSWPDDQSRAADVPLARSDFVLARQNADRRWSLLLAAGIDRGGSFAFREPPASGWQAGRLREHRGAGSLADLARSAHCGSAAVKRRQTRARCSPRRGRCGTFAAPGRIDLCARAVSRIILSLNISYTYNKLLSLLPRVC
jgi:hypothetical protein